LFYKKKTAKIAENLAAFGSWKLYTPRVPVLLDPQACSNCAPIPSCSSSPTAMNTWLQLLRAIKIILKLYYSLSVIIKNVFRFLVFFDF